MCSDLVWRKKGDIGMSSADPPNRFDRSAGAAHVNQPCGEIFFLWAKLCDHDGVKNTSWSPDIKLILDASKFGNGCMRTCVGRCNLQYYI